MARSMKTKTTKIDTEIQSAVENVEIENEKETVEKKPVKKVFAKDDVISCHSIAVGQTFMTGIKTGNTYIFESMGASADIEYQDLIAAVNVNSKFLFKPLIVVDDVDFINQSPKLKNIMRMYSINDLAQIFRLSPAKIKQELDMLPDGVKESVKSLTSEYIAKGKLDSVKVIKALDEYFGTQFMLLTGLYDD